MINVAAADQNTERIIDQEMSASLSRYFGDLRSSPVMNGHVGSPLSRIRSGVVRKTAMQT